MDSNKYAVIKKRIDRTMENLKKNNMQPYFCETTADAVKIVKGLLKQGQTVTTGGSVTLAEAGIIDLLKNGDYNYLDRNQKDLTREQVVEIYKKAFTCDVYLSSSNAVTEEGMLYNVDGNSNRVAAIIYGPDSVIIVVGYNKIVKNLDEAIARVKTISAPANTARLHTDAYCEKTGYCMSLNKDNSQMCDGCKGDGRICCNYVVTAKQRHKNRIKVIIIGEELGF